jgi:hypothetical protein
MNIRVDVVDLKAMLYAMETAWDQLGRDQNLILTAFTPFYATYINSDKAALEHQVLDYLNQMRATQDLAWELKNYFTSLVGIYETLSQFL